MNNEPAYRVLGKQALASMSPHEAPKAFWLRGEVDIRASRVGAAETRLDELNIAFDTHIELQNLYCDFILLALAQARAALNPALAR